jgi:hypothetical protein
LVSFGSSDGPSPDDTDTAQEPNLSVTVATDAAGIAGLAAGGKVAKVLGPVGAAVSISNDPSNKLNTATNLLGLVDGFEGMAVVGAFNDFFDWGANNSTPGPQKIYNNPNVIPLPVQDGGCLAAGMDSAC